MWFFGLSEFFPTSESEHKTFIFIYFCCQLQTIGKQTKWKEGSNYLLLLSSPSWFLFADINQDLAAKKKKMTMIKEVCYF